jgi:hypothetical protein
MRDIQDHMKKATSGVRKKVITAPKVIYGGLDKKHLLISKKQALTDINKVPSQDKE